MTTAHVEEANRSEWERVCLAPGWRARGTLLPL
jgi:hypothetical protein